MKILLLTDRLPFPLANGQNLRLFHFIRRLSRDHSFDIVAYGPKPYPAEIAPLFRQIVTLDSKPRPAPPQGMVRRLSAAFSPDHLIAFDPQMRDLLVERIRRESYDLVWISGWDMLVYLPDLGPVPVLADVVDEGVLEHLRVLRHARSTGAWFRSAKRLIQTYRFERKFFSAATLCNTVSDLDAAFVRRLCPGAKVEVIHNGVDLDFFAPSDETSGPPSLVFEGHMRFAPNVDAVLHFHREILPHIRRAVPEVRFAVVGKEPTPAIQALADDRVLVTGYVDDVRPYIAGSTLFVCPMRTGAGIKNKILQAWAMAKPVVATPQSCGGLRAVDGANIRIANGSRPFAKAVVDLLASPSARRELGRRGRETVEQFYGWDRQAGLLANLFQSVASARKPRG